jgi:hypothetical protein
VRLETEEKLRVACIMITVILMELLFIVAAIAGVWS